MSAVDDATAFLAGDSRDIGRHVLAMAAELDRLRLAARAMAGLAPDVLAAVPPDALRAVLAARGWTMAWRSPDGVEEYEHDDTLCDQSSATARVYPDTGEPRLAGRAHECVEIIASHHGESPAEVLAEVLREQSTASVKIPASGT